MSKSNCLYIIGKYTRREFPKNALPLFIHLRPDNVLIIKVDIKPGVSLKGLKQKLLEIVSTFFFEFKEHFYALSIEEDDILTNYKNYLEY